uniref:Uncharacterized protein n=1 Tax=Cacopsylla melanoneura TaxID=428564 RepID=A0A8D8VIJ0_9HEMI
MISPIEKLCLNFDTLSLSSHSESSTGSGASGSNISNMSHLLIEKSCEVFAKRLLQGLKNASFERNRGSLVRILRQEAKHLNNLVSSFTQDSRFKSVSLNRIHSTIAKCLGSLLITGCPPECVDWILRTFNEIGKGKLLTRSSLLGGDSPTSDHSPHDKSLDKEEDNASVLCLISQVLSVLGFNSSDGIIPEENSDDTRSSCGDDNIIRGILLQVPNNRPSQGKHNTNEDGSYNASKQSLVKSDGS